MTDSRTDRLRDELRSIVNRLDCDPDAVADELVAAVEAVLGESETVGWVDEWRVVGGSEDSPYTPVFEDKIYSEEHLEVVMRHANKHWAGEHLWVQRRKVGTTPWEKVPDA